MIENMHNGHYLEEIATLGQTASAAIEQLERICAAGKGAGLFRTDVSPLMLHWQISAMCVFNVSNEATFSINFGGALFSDEMQARLRRDVFETILASVLRRDEGSATGP